MPMPNRQIVNGEPYRYAYQGQEKDPETGKEAFQLRLWDARIGRWLTTDPYRQYHSPYVGMGNDPINGIDPDGGLFGRIRAWIYKQFNGGSIMKNDFDKWIWTPDTDITSTGNITDGYTINGIELGKSFGYGGLGKLKISNFDIGANVKLEAGIVYKNDKGTTGLTAKLATITLFDTPINYNTDKGFTFPKNGYYIGKNGQFKGSGPSLSVESKKIDYKAGITWDNQSNDTFKTYSGVGKPYLEFKHKIDSKGMSVHLGFQEDWGKSFGFFRVIGLSGKLNAKAQTNLIWEF